MRPVRTVAMMGTGTEVGKTFVCAKVVTALMASGRTVAVRKPLQSNFAGEETDADVLSSASGEQAAVVCAPGRSFDVPMAPPMAAAELGMAIPTVSGLLDEVTGSWPTVGAEFGFVEPAGGARSPYCSDGDSIDFVVALKPDAVVIVADAELGTINSTAMTVAVCNWAFDRAGLPTPEVFVYLNRYDPEVRLHVLNRAHLSNVAMFDVAETVEDLVAQLVQLGDN